MILVAGYNKYRQLIAESNDSENRPRINFRQNVLFNSNIRSFSTYAHHSVKIDENGHAYGIGKDINFRIGTPQREIYTEFTRIEFEGINENFISAHCGIAFTLYVTELNRLVLCCELDSNQTPRIFELDTKPVSLFGGCGSCAIVDENGDIYFIIPSALFKRINTNIFLDSDFYHLRPSIHLPSPAHIVSCGINQFLALSKDGNVYLIKFENLRVFEKVSIQKQNEASQIISIAGSCNAFFAIDSDGFIYGYSQCQKYSQLGTSNKSCQDRFVLIESLQDKQIESAFCGIGHSFFITKDGDLFSCGSNRFRQLFIDDFNEQMTSIPLKVDLDKSSKAKFAIAGNAVSVAFLNNVPKNMPNLVNSLISSKKTAVKKVTKRHFMPKKVSMQEPIKNFSTPSSPKTMHFSTINPARPTTPVSFLPTAFSEPSSPIRVPSKSKTFSETPPLVNKKISISSDDSPSEKSESTYLKEKLKKCEDENEKLKAQNSVLYKILKKMKNKNERNDDNSQFISFEELNEMKHVRYLSQAKTIDVSLVEKNSGKIEYFVQKTFKGADYKKFKKFFREFGIISSISHPCIVKFYRYSNVTPNIPFPLLLTEYLPYNLKEIFQSRNKLNDTMKVSIIVDLAVGLHFLHDVKKIMHRNLKPENILLTKKFHAKIADFAWANSIDIDFAYSRMGDGSMTYMAPELLNGDDYDEKVDQFSFGKIIYFILNNGKKAPYNFNEYEKGITFVKTPSMNDLACDIISRCCNITPENRPLFSDVIKMIEKGGFLLLPNVDANVVKERISKLHVLEQIENMNE